MPKSTIACPCWNDTVCQKLHIVCPCWNDTVCQKLHIVCPCWNATVCQCLLLPAGFQPAPSKTHLLDQDLPFTCQGPRLPVQFQLKCIRVHTWSDETLCCRSTIYSVPGCTYCPLQVTAVSNCSQYVHAMGGVGANMLICLQDACVQVWGVSQGLELNGGVKTNTVQLMITQCPFLPLCLLQFIKIIIVSVTL